MIARQNTTWYARVCDSELKLCDNRNSTGDVVTGNYTITDFAPRIWNIAPTTSGQKTKEQYEITWNANDTDLDSLTFKIYYTLSQGEYDNLITTISDTDANCDISSGDTYCSYVWDTASIGGGDYYITINNVSGTGDANWASIIKSIDGGVGALDLSPTYIKFALVGAIGTLVNLGVLALLRYVFGLIHEIASAISIEASIINNFILNDIWTFRHRRRGSWVFRLIKFHLSCALAVLTQYIVSVATYHLLIAESVIAQFLGILAGFIINYLISKTYVWR